ncbi:hypothetical protein TWF506_002462 [Arthrobotrys conoides]|uniref:Uncharacterized protein n=1 Tax=Arthrobotrys conoides TaxID=74498 RepID=A0AAN8MZU8_9PEZI
MFFSNLKTIFAAALLATRTFAAPSPASEDVGQLEMSQSTDAAFTVARGQFREINLVNLAASLDIQTFWKPSGDPTSIIFAHKNDLDSSVDSPSKSRYLEISFGGLDDKITVSSRFNGTCEDQIKTSFTLAEASFETSPTTKERLIRMSLMQGFGSWRISFSTNVPGFGEDHTDQSITFTPHTAVTDGGIEPNYIWYQSTENSSLSAELQCGIGWW